MIHRPDKKSIGIFKTLMAAHFILLLHVILIVIITTFVLFFSGIVYYMPWLLLFSGIGIGTSAWMVIRRLKKNRLGIKEALQSPVLGNRNLEISILGGLASLRLGAGRERAIPARNLLGEGPGKKEEPDIERLKELARLAEMLKDDLITLEEFNIFKKRVMKS